MSKFHGSQVMDGEFEYKIDELATVTDETLERLVNRRMREGWRLEDIKFAMRDASKRPSMAFVFFVRPLTPETAERWQRESESSAGEEDSRPRAPEISPEENLAHRRAAAVLALSNRKQADEGGESNEKK